MTNQDLELTESAHCGIGMRRGYPRNASALVALVCVLLIGFSSAHAGTITVGNDDPGVVVTDAANPSVGNCSLREAVFIAVGGSPTSNDCRISPLGDSPPHTVEFTSNFTIQPNGMPTIDEAITIEGPVTLDGTDQSPLFSLGSGGDLTLDGDTFGPIIVRNCNGFSCITGNDETVTVNMVTFMDNDSNSIGGAIRSGGTLNVIASTFLNNNADTTGGAIHFTGSQLSIVASIFGAPTMGNTAGGNGGALYLDTSDSGTVWNITGSFFVDNESQAAGGSQGGNGGGAIWADMGGNLSSFSIAATEFLDNRAPNGTGGAIAFGLSNQIGFIAGASDIGDLSAGGIFASHFNGNTAGGPAGQGGAGGAIHNRGDDMVIVATSFENNSSTNSAGGAIAENGSSATSTLVNVTMNNNTAGTDGGGIAHLATNGTFTVLNSTVSGNIAGNEGGGIWNDAPGFTVVNSIVANNTANSMSMNPGANCGGPNSVVNGGNNLQFDPGMDTTVCGGGTPFGIGDPDLGSFQYNGGVHLLVETMEPGPNSAAHGGGSNTVCADFPVLNLDARDVIPVRPDPGGSSCDIGAFESSLGPPLLDLVPDAGLDFMDVVVGQNSTLQATLNNTGDLAANNVQLMVSGGNFSLTNDTCSGGSLTAMGSCNVDIVFAPAVAGTQNQTLTAMADGGLLDVISIDGNGQDPAALDLLPDAGLDFMMVETGMTSSQMATLSNAGDVPATGLTLSFSGGDFSLNNDTCMGTVPANGSCTVDVVFGPLADGAQSESLNAMADGGLMDSIAVVGTGFSGAALALSPDPIDFMMVETGMSETLPIQLENTGGEAASNVMLSISGGDFSLTNDGCSGNSLPAGNICTADVVFDPQTDGPQSETLMASATGGIMDTASLSGTGFTPAGLEIMPDPIDFMMVETGQTSTIGAVVTNTGGQTTGTIVLSVSGGDFTITNDTCTGNTLPAGNACALDIEFAPTADGAQSEMFSASDGGAASDTVALTGTGFSPAGLVFTPPVVDFMMVETGMSSNLQVTLENIGGQTADNVQLAISGGDFSLTNDLCSATNLSAGNTCTADVAFAPLADGMQTESIMVNADGGLMASSTLSGTGFTPAGLSLSPDPVDFSMVETGMSSTLQVTLENTGGQTANNVMLAISGGDFTLTNDLCTGINLAMNTTCTADVEFAPQADGMQNESLTVGADGGLNDTASLTGTGFTPMAMLELTPDPVDFGSVQTGTSSTIPVTLNNTGTIAATNVVLAVSGGDFSLMNNTCPAVLPASASCTADAEFAPAVDGMQTQTLTATSDGPMETASLIGTGFTPAGDIDVTPDQGLDFGSQLVNTSSGLLMADVENTGQSTLDNLAIQVSGDFFRDGGSCGTNLSAGASCTVGIRFAPSALGPLTGTLTTTANGGAMDAINLAGEGLPAAPGPVSIHPIPVNDRRWLLLLMLGVLVAGAFTARRPST